MNTKPEQPHIIVIGDLSSGFHFVGPFATHEEALEHAECVEQEKGRNWFIVQLEEPQS